MAMRAASPRPPRLLLLVLLLMMAMLGGVQALLPPQRFSLRLRPSMLRVAGLPKCEKRTPTRLCAVHGPSRRRIGPGILAPRSMSRFTVSNALIALNVVSYLLASRNAKLRYKFMKINHRVAHGELYRLVTSLFVHANVHHLFTNSYTLAQIGPMAERVLGPELLVFIYCGSGALANLASYLLGLSPYTMGASGATFGLMGAVGMFMYMNMRAVGPMSKLVLDNLRQTVVLNLIYGLANTGIDNIAHVGGLVVGALLTMLVRPSMGAALSAKPFRALVPSAVRRWMRRVAEFWAQMRARHSDRQFVYPDD